MALRKTASEVLSDPTNAELVSALTTADIIAAEHSPGGEKTTLWKRPIAEVEARGLPANVVVMTITYASRDELRRMESLVSRLKHGDAV